MCESNNLKEIYQETDLLDDRQFVMINSLVVSVEIVITCDPNLAGASRGQSWV